MKRREVSDRDRFIKFYPSDWRGDDELQSCSLAARGLWWELCCLAFKYGGVVLIAGEIPDVAELAKQAKATKTETVKLIAELEKKGVASRRQDGALYSRRLMRDAHKRAINKANGDKGGNPSLFDWDKRSVGESAGSSVDQSVNRTANPHGSPESRDQNPEPRTNDADRSRSNDRDGIAPSWRAQEARPATLVEPRTVHAKCYDAPMACARGLCLPRFQGRQWEAQLGAGQPDGYSASAAVVARMNAIVERVAPGTTVGDTLDWWRAQWAPPIAARRGPATSDQPHQRTWDDGVESLLDRIGLQLFFRGAWFQHARLRGDVLSVRPGAVEWVTKAYLDDLRTAHGETLVLEAFAEEAVPV